MHCIVLYCIVLYYTIFYCNACILLYFIVYCTVLYCTVLYCIVLYYIVLYCVFSHTLKNTANQRPGLPLHILRYATDNIQRVVFLSTFPSLLARILGSI